MIRPIEKNDIASCLAIYNQYIEKSTVTFETERLNLQQFTARVDAVTERYPWIVLEEEGEVLGYAYLDSFNPRAAYQWVCDLSIYLDPSSRGKGLGSMLMDAILRLARRDGYLRMTSIITSDNVASRRFHDKYGFRKIAEFPNIGYKNHMWLGVAYYIKDLTEELPEHPEPVRNLSL